MSDSPTPTPLLSPKPNSKITFALIVTTFVGSLGFFSFGYEISVLNSPELVVEDWVNQSYAKRGSTWRNETTLENVPGLSHNQVRLIFSVAVAIFALGGMFGSLLAGRMADRFGRRKANLLNAFLALVAAPLMAISGWTAVPELLIIGRFLMGISNGAATVLSPMYLVESAPVAVRGGIGICSNIAGTAGIFLATVFGLPVVLGSASLWPYIFIIAAIAPAVQVVLLTLCCYESPRYLYISCRDKVGAERVLQKLCARYDVSQELDELEHECRTVMSAKHVSVRDLIFRERIYAWPLAVALVIHLSQQLSGSNGILAYSGILFQQTGLTRDESSYASLSLGIIMCGMSFVTAALVDKFGRKFFHLIGIAGCIVFGLLTTFFSALPEWMHIPANHAVVYSIVAIVCVLLYLTLFAVGPASIPWVVVAELFDQGARSSATSIVCAVNWIGQLVCFVIFPTQQAALGAYVFMPHVIIESIFIIFLLRYMPETNGKTFEDVVEYFKPRAARRSAARRRRGVETASTTPDTITPIRITTSYGTTTGAADSTNLVNTTFDD